MDHKRSLICVVVLLGILPFLNGCAAIALTLFGAGAGVATGTSVGYTLDGFAYRTLHGAFASGGKRNADGPESDGYNDRGDCED
jgi:hypothetical protein